MLGNQTRVTDAKGGTSYTYYDALGRVKAVTEAARLNASGASYAPLTVFYRDAVGNIIRTIQYANGTPQASEAGYTETSSGDNRYTFAAYDSRGNKIQTIDANGARTNYSYNAAGQLAKQWRGVTGNDGSVKTWFQAFQYDKLGHQTRVIDPASTTVLKSGVQTSWSSATKEFNFWQKYVVSGTNTINLNWSSLIDASAGLVRVQVYYTTLNTQYSETVANEGGEAGEGGVSTGGTTITYGSPGVATSRTMDFGAASSHRACRSAGANARWPWAALPN
ncbi:hypothetical protein WJ970_09585 [Achromobacter xylosoxidans]